MDFLDGSDVEEADVDLDEENALLGSDDEEYPNNGVEYEYDEEHILQTEDSDVLELELNVHDGLDFEEEDLDHVGRRNVAPVQVRASAIPTGGGQMNQSNQNFESMHQQGSYESDHNGPSGVSAEMDEEDDEDDDRNTRSRFQSERNTQHMNSSAPSASGSSFGNPIQTLGGRKVPTVDGGQRQKPWGNGRPHPQGQRQFPRPQRFQQNRHPLLGDGPRPPFHSFQRPQMNGNPNVQFQERIFTDFNQPMRPTNPQQLAMIQNQRATGPRNMNNNGPRPGNNLGPRPRPPNPPFPQGNNNNNNRQMRPRNHNPGSHMNQRPPQWRNQRPQRHPFPPNMGNPHQQMQNMSQMQPGPHQFNQDQRPPMFGHGIRPEMRPQAPFNNASNSNLPPGIPPQPFGPSGIIGQQFRMPMQPDLMPPVQPVQPIQQFFHPQHQQQHHQQHQQQQQQQQGFMQEPQNPQAYWQPPENNGWNGSPQQNFMGLIPNPHINAAFQMHLPLESAIPNQPHNFVESQTLQGQQPGHVYDQSNQRPEPAYFDQQRPQYQHYDHETRVASFEQHGQRIQARVPEIPSQREVYDERSEYQYSRQERIPPVKRKCEPEDRYNRGSPEKRLNGRLGPPVKHQSPVRDEKAEELMKIREESRKTMGVDDEYIKKLEDQKRLREQILKRKAEARKKINGIGGSEEESDVRRLGNEMLKTEAVASKTSGRSSIYINPRAFTGDLGLNPNLKKINMDSAEEGQPSNTPLSKVSTTVKNDGSAGSVPVKPRTILRIVKDKHGNVISRSKVIVRAKQQPSASTKTS